MMKFVPLFCLQVLTLMQPEFTVRKLIKVDNGRPQTLSYEPKSKDSISINSDSKDVDYLVDPGKLSPDSQPILPEKTETGNSDFKCNNEITHSYGLSGVLDATVEPHPYCPKIQRNCCSKEDANLSAGFWSNTNHIKIEQFYQSFELMLNYMLGFSIQGRELAKEMKNHEGKCIDAAKEFESLNTESGTLDRIQKSISKSVRAKTTLRAGFYCHICDYTAQSFIFQAPNNYEKGSIVLSRDACQRLVETTIQESYYRMTYMRTLFTSMSVMIGCKAGDTEEIVFEDKPEEIEFVKKCFSFRENFMVGGCDAYCGKFHFTRPDPLFDGKIDVLYKFFQRFYKYKNLAFPQPSMNPYVITMDLEENQILQNMEQMNDINTNFYETMGIKDEVSLESFTTSTSENEGLDLFNVIEDKGYYSFMTATALSWLSASLLLLFWF